MDDVQADPIVESGKADTWGFQPLDSRGTSALGRASGPAALLPAACRRVVLRPEPEVVGLRFDPAHAAELTMAEEEGFEPSVPRKRDDGFKTAPFDRAAAGHRASDSSPGTLPNSARYSGSP